MAGKRTDYLSWDEYFMSIVSLASLRSVYSSSGACLVDSEVYMIRLQEDYLVMF